MEYRELRAKYPVFYFHDFAVIESEQILQVHFDFEIPGLSHFNPEFTICKPAGSTYTGNLRNVREAAFSLGLAELVSYWKLTCSHQVIVECGSLDEEQIRWWKQLYFRGLSDFFECNHIDADEETFMDLVCDGQRVEGDWDHRKFHGNLIPVGGGKDSVVTLEVLKPCYEENTAFIINHVLSAVHTAALAGYEKEKCIIAERSLDPRMLDFNKQGFLNGPVPYSALLAFGSALTAIVNGKKYICLSNESTTSDRSAKPQYARTYAFEKSFQDYMDRYVTGQVHYFSLLRPVNHLIVTGIFATLKKYHPVFHSCNRGMKEDRWCGHCAKCLFTCIMLSAYLSDEELVQIFHADLLNDSSLLNMFLLLTGFREENVEIREDSLCYECNAAVCMSIAAHKAAGLPLPLLYQNYEQSDHYRRFRDAETNWDYWNEENMVPDEYQKLLKQKIQEIRNK